MTSMILYVLYLYKLGLISQIRQESMPFPMNKFTSHIHAHPKHIVHRDLYHSIHFWLLILLLHLSLTDNTITCSRVLSLRMFKQHPGNQLS
jgi:hypothetical protein